MRSFSFCTRFLFAGAGLGVWGASVKGREWSALEDPVKNGACLRHVKPRRGLKGRVRRLGSGGVRNSPVTSSPQTPSTADVKKKPP